MNQRDEAVLEMAQRTFQKVKDITEPVDMRKRFDLTDTTDRYGEVIGWVHETGADLFGSVQ
jgi:hypothetical protein